MNHIAAICCCVLLLPAFPTGSEAAAPPAARSATDLNARLLSAQGCIKGVAVELRSPALPGQATPEGAFVRRLAAAATPHYLLSSVAHGHSRLDWSRDPFQTETYVQGSDWYHWFRRSRVCFQGTLDKSATLPPWLGDIFWSATGWWPPDELPAPRPGDKPYVLRDVALSANYGSIRARQECVSGRWCHVLEDKDGDVLWLDLERNCTMMQREFRLGGALTWRFTLGDHTEAAPGVWVPGWIQNEQFDYTAADAEARLRKVIDAKITIKVLGVNDLDPAMFAFPKPAGTAQRIKSGEPVVQLVSGGMDHLDDIADTLPRAKKARTTRWPLQFSLVVLVSLVCLGDMVHRSFRWYRSRRSRAPGGP